MLTRIEAISFVRSIPAVAAVYNAGHDPFLGVLVDSTKGQLPNDPPQDFYRPWIAAYRYLQQSPDLHLIKRHDRTELGSYQNPLAMLLEQQAAEDSLYEAIVPPGQEAGIISPDHYTVSVRVTPEF